MQAEEIREMAIDDIRSRIAELEEERFRLRFRSATQSLEDPLRVRAVRPCGAGRTWGRAWW